MNPKRHRVEPWLMISAFGVVCALAAVAGLLGPLPAASADLPPRPTPITPTTAPSPQPTAVKPTSTPTPKPQKPAGAWIALRVLQPGSDLSFTWQELWTVVQWQDTSGRWHDVEGWRGTLDTAVSGMGSKIWWVAQKDLGTGPFRWVVRHGPGGEHLAGSEPFTLPEATALTVDVEVVLAP